MKNVQKLLAHKAYRMRVASLVSTTQAGSGHPTTCLSAADLVAALFFYAMRFEPANPDNPNNDRFILSKGHAAPLLYAAWQEVGVLSEDDLLTLRQFDSVLEGHPTLRFKQSEAATGSLGQGLSIGAGMALSAKMDQFSFATYVLMGDSEIAEGSIWEAAEIASYYKLNNLIGIVDVNRLGQSSPALHEYDMQRYAHKFDAFGWNTIVIDGHDMAQIINAFDQVQQLQKTSDKPIVILAKTIKGYGVQRVQDKEGFHGKVFTQEELPDILNGLKKRFAADAEYSAEAWQPILPEAVQKKAECTAIDLGKPTFDKDTKMATRKAYGRALVALGKVCPDVVVLDAEVKNSTYAQMFEQQFPERFVQCFTAEQNMVGMAVGFYALKHIPFASTFAAFFSRAFDQVRMAAIGQAALRLVGSHAGVSIGQDGPSQMGLEDIALMRALPASVVLYPADAVATYRLVEQMANYHEGISYLRTTRMETPIIYSLDERFPIGGCKILRKSDKDQACVVAAGITVFQALKAYEQLKKEGINIAVIDLYSIKPIDVKTVCEVGMSSGKRIITVEDHYLEGGIGQSVVYELRNSGLTIDVLAVHKLPRSGVPEQLFSYEGIDAAAIIKKIKS